MPATLSPRSPGRRRRAEPVDERRTTCRSCGRRSGGSPVGSLAMSSVTTSWAPAWKGWRRRCARFEPSRGALLRDLRRPAHPGRGARRAASPRTDRARPLDPGLRMTTQQYAQWAHSAGPRAWTRSHPPPSPRPEDTDLVVRLDRGARLGATMTLGSDHDDGDVDVAEHEALGPRGDGSRPNSATRSTRMSPLLPRSSPIERYVDRSSNNDEINELAKKLGVEAIEDLAAVQRRCSRSCAEEIAARLDPPTAAPRRSIPTNK